MDVKLPPTRLPKCYRIICIGDIHGDYDALIISLKKANLIDNKNNWIGKNTVVIQIGDILDGGGRGVNISGDEEIKIMYLLAKLHLEAIKMGGGVYSLIGNHELMNVMGDFSYVSAVGSKKLCGLKNRRDLFRPGGRLAKYMAITRNVIMQVGNWLFVHGGINYNIANNYNLSDINKLFRAYLMGNKSLERSRLFKILFTSNDSLLWSRKMSSNGYNRYQLSNNEMEFERIMDRLKIKGIVVGHSMQEDGINSICNNRLWRIDVGMSAAFNLVKTKNYNDNIQVLEILNDGQQINIIK